MSDAKLIERARGFAIRHHGLQVRKYTGDPYWHHCRDVAEMVATVPEHTPEMLAAAYVHDTGEDTTATYAEIALELGMKVATMVWWLTDTPHVAGNRETRKRVDRARLALAPPEVKTIKLCDLIDNSKSIIERDPDFAKVYLPEKWRLLNESLLGGDNDLWKRAHAMLGAARHLFPAITEVA